MSQHRIELLPLRKTVWLTAGSTLQDLLFAQGVEFPCGGRGRCKGCRIKVLQGRLPVTDDDQRLLKAQELDEGWRLACRAVPTERLQIEIAQWEAAILADESQFAFTPREGLGLAVDLGTTTVVAQLLDLNTGQVLAVRMELNTQARHGADIMSRIDYATHHAFRSPGSAGVPPATGAAQLTELIRRQIGQLIDELLASAPERGGELRDAVIVGNTVMHHLFCGIDVTPLSHHPFTPVDLGEKVFTPAALGWALPAAVTIRFLPCLGGFVGSDILAGIFATRLHESSELRALIDLGTNGEIVVGNQERMLCTSTAAGPAFEGARITMGMRAATGAISEVRLEHGHLRCHTIGGGQARGLCGSGLVDAVAAGLELGLISPSGRLTQSKAIALTDEVILSQSDVRELQLAKGAIAAGLQLLVAQLGAGLSDLRRVSLAGAFGNYINRSSARSIGLIQFPPEMVYPVGNTALLGAKLALFAPEEFATFHAGLEPKLEHTGLNEDARFQEVFVEQMAFPEIAERLSP